MNSKTTPISVRITPQDATFIAELEIGEAETPSDKIRALLKEARESRERNNELSTYLGLVRKAVNPLFDQIKKQELADHKHSELISFLGEWIVKLLSYLATLDGSKCDLERVEVEIGTRLFRLFDFIARRSPLQPPSLRAPAFFETMLAIQIRSICRTSLLKGRS